MGAHPSCPLGTGVKNPHQRPAGSVRGVTRPAMRDRILRTAGWYLEDDDNVLGIAQVWATDADGTLPLLFRQRSFYDLVVTDQHVVLLERPPRFRAPWRRHRTPPDRPLVAEPHAAFTVVHVRRFALLLQVRLRADKGEIVLEFRPLDRGIARVLVDRIRSASPAPRAA
jgi:hypothetical protein